MKKSDLNPRNRRNPLPAGRAASSVPSTKLRIIAGFLGGRRITYHGDPTVRPMKEKTREAIFSVLGGYLDDTLAIDLFAGTGILGFESVSRGSRHAVLLELSRPTVSTLLENMRVLKLEERVTIRHTDALRWMRGAAVQTSNFLRCPWIVFCCPPYWLWTHQTARLVEGLTALYACAPPNSRFICESEESFDLPQFLPDWRWDIRHYKPARVVLATKS